MNVKPSHFAYPANLLSLLRLALAVPITYLVANPELDKDLLLVALIALAVLTDLFDGFLSRWLKQVSDLGKVLDPIADKVIIVAGILAAVLYRGFPAPIILFLAYRDLMLVSFGLVVTRRANGVVLANSWGKLNTLLMSFLCFSFIVAPVHPITLWLGYLGVVTTWASGITYYAFGEPYLFRGPVRWLTRLGLFALPLVLWALLRHVSPHLNWW